MDRQRAQTQDCQELSRSSRLRIFTKLLREPIVVSGSAYRSGAHPILAVRVAAEVARSPKVGLVQKLMAEGRQAFVDSDYPKAIVKSLAAEELLRKYGGILAQAEEKEIREQLQFLKIQYFLLSGQAGEAYKAFRQIRHRSHPYLWHCRQASRSGVGLRHWDAVESTLRQFFRTNRSMKIFNLLGYAVVMGSQPGRAATLADDLNFEVTESPIFTRLYQDYSFLTGRVCAKDAELLPEYLATSHQLSPLLKEGGTLFLGCVQLKNELIREDVKVRVEGETVFIPMEEKALVERNSRLY